MKEVEAWREDHYSGRRYVYSNLGNSCTVPEEGLRSAKNHTDYGVYFYPDDHCHRESDSIYVDSGGEQPDFGFDARSFRSEDPGQN